MNGLLADYDKRLYEGDLHWVWFQLAFGIGVGVADTTILLFCSFAVLLSCSIALLCVYTHRQMKFSAVISTLFQEYGHVQYL